VFSLDYFPSIIHYTVRYTNSTKCSWWQTYGTQNDITCS